MAADTANKAALDILDSTAKKAQLIESAASATTAYDMIGMIINILLGFLGVVFLILIIYGGITWMTAGGNEEKVTKARTRMINAVIGLVIVMIAYGITYFVISRLKESFIEAGRAGEEIEAPNQQE